MDNKSRILAILMAGFIACLFIWLICNQIKEHHLQNDPMIHDLRDIITPLFPDIKNIKIYESEGKSYTINKEKVFLCLKDDNGDYYNKKMLIYVLLHEYSHVINDEIGHTEKFHKLFDEVLDKAINAGLYDPNIPVVKNYCDHKE